MRVTFTYPLPSEPHLAWAPDSLSGLIDRDYTVRIEGRDNPVVAKVTDAVMRDGKFAEMTLDFSDEDFNQVFTLFGQYPIDAKWEF